MVFLFNPEITLRWRKVVDPSLPKPQWKNGKRQKTNGEDLDVKAFHVEVIAGMEVPVRNALSSMYSKQNGTGPLQRVCNTVKY